MQNIDFLSFQKIIVPMIERTLLSEVRAKLFKGKALMVYGARQTGKTTLVNELIKNEGLDPVYLTGDDDDDKALFEKVTLSRWTQILGNRKSVFIDEGQKIPNLSRSVKLLIDNRDDVLVIITGSSSFKLKALSEEPLTGRKYEYKLFPLSYKELSDHYGYIEEKKSLELRLIYGSYPEVVTHPEDMKELLTLISDSYLYRDLFQYEGIRKPQVLEKLLKALALQMGSEVSINELSLLLGVSRTLLQAYINLLIDAYIIFPLSSYSTNQRNELKKSMKYYFWDNGIRNSILKNFTPFPQRDDTGALFENYMVSERMKRNIYSHSNASSYFWRTTDGMEVDYIETEGNKIRAFEFKLNPNKKSRVTAAFTNRYPRAELETVTSDNYPTFLG